MAARRRQRYVIFTPEGEQLHCLAYSAAWVLNAYPDAADVQLWSQVKRERASHEGTWTLDREALAEACDFFGLRHAVDVEFLDGAATVVATHAFAPHGEAYVRSSDRRILGLDTATAEGVEWRHIIRIRRGQPAAAASRALWHELTHAMQAERATGRLIAAGASPRRVYEAWRDYHAKGRNRIAYADKPVEVEARAHEDYADALPLVKSVGSRTTR